MSSDTCAPSLQDTLLQARQQMLDQLRNIYEERNDLNQITMSLMLPRPSHNCGETGEKGQYLGTTAVKMQFVERWGGGCMLAQSAELFTALDRLKANLTGERKLLLQMLDLLLKKARSIVHAAFHLAQGAEASGKSCTTDIISLLTVSCSDTMPVASEIYMCDDGPAMQVLSPLQAAVMFVQADTDPVEPLHISNLVAMQKGLIEAPPHLQLDAQADELLMRPYRATGRASGSSEANHFSHAVTARS
jgi:hypothetical protein